MTGDYYSFYLILSTRRASRRNTTSLTLWVFCCCCCCCYSNRPPHLTASNVDGWRRLSLFLLVPKSSFCYLVPAMPLLPQSLKMQQQLWKAQERNKKREERGLSCLYTTAAAMGREGGIEQVMHTHRPPSLILFFFCVCTAVAATNCVHWTCYKQKVLNWTASFF